MQFIYMYIVKNHNLKYIENVAIYTHIVYNKNKTIKENLKWK